MVGARHEVMEATVDMIENDFGGVEEFLTGMMNIDKRTVKICKEVLQYENRGLLYV